MIIFTCSIHTVQKQPEGWFLEQKDFKRWREEIILFAQKHSMRKFLYKVNQILFLFYKLVNSFVYLQAKSDTQRTAAVAKTGLITNTH